MTVKLAEHTYGTHIYMRIMLDNRRVEEIDVHLQPDGSMTYQTSADPGMELNPEEHQKNREMIIKVFNELY